MSKQPVSVLVVVHTPAPDFLLLRRAGPDGFWQSVTGSLEANETPRAAAQREMFEETGIELQPEHLADWRLCNRFVIPARWRARYAKGITHNTEYVFSIELADCTPPRLSPGEHVEACWLSPGDAMRRAWSWTNRDAIRLVLARQRC